MPRSWLVLACALLGCDEEVGAVREPSPEFTPSAKRTAECPPGDPARERYGTDCACCHGTQFAASGSVAEEALALVSHVEMVDRVGQVFILPPNRYGNFFGHRPTPQPPLRAKVVYRDGHESAMQADVGDASCNRCHGSAGSARMIGAPQ